MEKFTPGPIGIEKCRCGHRACNQHRLSTQGSVGFDLADATLYAAAPDLYEALKAMVARPDQAAFDLAAAALRKATGEPA